MEAKKEHFALQLIPRGDDDPHIMAQLRQCDANTLKWTNIGSTFSTFWLEDLQLVIQETLRLAESQNKDPSGFGHVFKTKTE